MESFTEEKVEFIQQNNNSKNLFEFQLSRDYHMKVLQITAGTYKIKPRNWNKKFNWIDRFFCPLVIRTHFAFCSTHLKKIEKTGARYTFYRLNS